MAVMKEAGMTPAQPSRVFFTSDTHFGHARILDLCPDTRRFADVDEMNDAIVDRINSVVPEDATLFHLGDVALGGWKQNLRHVARLSARNKVLLPGNHDAVHPSDKRHKRADIVEAFDAVFSANLEHVFWVRLPVETVAVIPLLSDRPGIGLTMSHFPMKGLEHDDRFHEWMMEDIGQSIHLCGHVHDAWGVKWTDNGVMNINVGWDAWERPLSLTEILTLWKRG